MKVSRPSPAVRRSTPGILTAQRPCKRHGAAAFETLGFQAAPHRIDHAFVKPDDYAVSIGSESAGHAFAGSFLGAVRW